MDYQRRPDSAFPGPRRVFTAPTYAGSAPETTSSTNNGGSVETLYNHPSVKIVAFTAGPRPVFSYGKDVAPPPEIAPGSLPWSSQLERTIAAGAPTLATNDLELPLMLTPNQVNSVYTAPRDR